MEDWTKKADEDVFSGASEQPGSQAAYWRDTEIRRRLYLLEKQLLAAQLDSVASQKSATAEMAKQSRLMFYSVIGIFLTAIATLIASLIK